MREAPGRPRSLSAGEKRGSSGDLGLKGWVAGRWVGWFADWRAGWFVRSFGCSFLRLFDDSLFFCF